MCLVGHHVDDPTQQATQRSGHEHDEGMDVETLSHHLGLDEVLEGQVRGEDHDQHDRSLCEAPVAEGDDHGETAAEERADVGDVAAHEVDDHDAEQADDPPATEFIPLTGEVYKYPDSQWKTAFIGNDYQWLRGDPIGGRDLDARTLFFYIATVNTPAMALHIPGVGSQYAYTEHDSTGEYLDGARSYQLVIPPNVPAKDFWSVVLYDPQTRSELQTSQPYPSKNNTRNPLTSNADGSITLTFGPTEAAERPENWTQTVPGKRWFTILRLYGPLEPWFDKSWVPGEIEPLQP